MEQNNMPHLGGLINKKIYEKRHTRLSVGKLLGKHQMTVKGYTQEPSVQARILWDLSKALNYDFFEHLSNSLDLNNKKIGAPTSEVLTKSQQIQHLESKVADLEKELAIYKEILVAKR
jgi:hypothetical protein